MKLCQTMRAFEAQPNLTIQKRGAAVVLVINAESLKNSDRVTEETPPV